MNRVLLIRPPINRFRPTYLSSESPLNLMYIVAALKNAGLECKILDFESVVFSKETLYSYIDDYDPQIIGVTAFTCTVGNANHIGQVIKEKYRDRVTVLGGVHVSTLPRDSVIDFPAFDYIYVGEGEVYFPEFCNRLLAGEIDNSKDINIPGVCYRKPDGSIIINPPSLIMDLDSIIFPDRSQDFEIGSGVKGLKTRKEMRYAEILTSRGCPFRCTFCAVEVVHSSERTDVQRVRQRTVENVIEEITLLKNKYGVNHLDIIDSTFTVNRKRAMPIIEAIGELGLTYNLNAIINTVDYGLLKKMAETGCQKISFGIETGSPEILKKINKRIKVEKIIEKVDAAREVNIPVIECSYIVGVHPDETEEDIIMTEKLMNRLNADVSVVSIGIPFPGTQMYDQFKTEKLYHLGNNWDDFSFYGARPNVRTRYVSNERLLYLQKRMMRNYYFHPKRIVKNVKKIKSFGQLKTSLRAAFDIA